MGEFFIERKILRRRKRMGLFEQHPWLLIPLVVIIMEGWSGAKALAGRVKKQAIKQ
jgi:hypothetical protein